MGVDGTIDLPGAVLQAVQKVQHEGGGEARGKALQGEAEVEVLLEPVYRATTERVLTEGEFVSAEDVASALQKLYDDRDMMTATIWKGYPHYAMATREE